MDNQQESLYKLAYSVGFFLGDGNLYCAVTRGSYQLRFEKADLDCLERVSKEIGEVFGNPGRISSRRRRSYYSGKLGIEVHQLTVCCKAAHHWFADVTLNRTSVPELYFEAPTEVRQALLAGLMDSDGSAELSKAGYVTVRFTNANLGLVDAVRGLARTLGISCGDVIPDYRAKRVGYRMTLNTKAFASNAYFYSDRKDSRLDAYREKLGCI